MLLTKLILSLQLLQTPVLQAISPIGQQNELIFTLKWTDLCKFQFDGTWNVATLPCKGTYQVFFGKTNPPSLAYTVNKANNTWVTYGLYPSCSYYWRVVSDDGQDTGIITIQTPKNSINCQLK